MNLQQQQEEFKKLMDREVLRMQAEHREFMKQLSKQLVKITLLFALALYLQHLGASL